MGLGARLAQDRRQVLGGALAAAIAEVEGLGGTVTSVFGPGLVRIWRPPVP